VTNTTVKYELVGHVAVITLNDPATLNAFSDAMIEALGQALDRAEAEAGAIVLTGEGKGFSSGLNLGLAPAEKQSREQRDTGARLERVFNPLLLRLRNLAIPLVIAANGVAAGIGCSIALVGDFIVASEKAYFLQAFASIGLVPDGGSPFLLAAAAGRVRAMEMMHSNGA